MRFFNKDFFKFTVGFLSIISLSLLILAAVSAYAAGVSQIAFTTEERQVKPNEISESITIQTQDTGGTSIQTPETIDLEFTSTSATGEFLNSSGNPVSTTMSKNTSNRTFYYRDSSAGSFTITVTATGRESFQSWSASQQIIVSSNTSGNQNSSNTFSAGGNNNTQTSGISNTGATGGPSTPMTGILTSTLEIVAGTDRITTPGSPLLFQALVKKGASNIPEFDWSFGDGNVGRGSLVTHTYKYPGDYAVVVNVRSGDNFAASRFKVKVIEPDIEVAAKDGYVEITNNSTNEVNLFNWRIENGGKGFVFQPDTIVLPKATVRFENSLLKMNWAETNGLALKDSLNRPLVEVPAKPNLDFTNLALELDLLKTQALSLQSKIYALVPTGVTTNVAHGLVESVEAGEGIERGDIEPQSQTASVVLYESQEGASEGNGLTNFIKKIFSR